MGWERVDDYWLCKATLTVGYAKWQQVKNKFFALSKRPKKDFE
jgi:hypothetical protein